MSGNVRLQMNRAAMKCLEGQMLQELRLSSIYITAAAVAALPCCPVLRYLELAWVRVSVDNEDLEVMEYEPDATGARICARIHGVLACKGSVRCS